MVIASRTVAQQPLDQGKVAQQAGASIARHHFLHRAAEVDIDDIEAQVLAVARGVRHHGRVGAEKLRGNGVLIRVEIADTGRRGVGFVARADAHDAVGAGELRHDEPAAALGADQAAEDGVSDAGHGRQDRGGTDFDRADFEGLGEH